MTGSCVSAAAALRLLKRQGFGSAAFSFQLMPGERYHIAAAKAATLPPHCHHDIRKPLHFPTLFPNTMSTTHNVRITTTITTIAPPPPPTTTTRQITKGDPTNMPLGPSMQPHGSPASQPSSTTPPLTPMCPWAPSICAHHPHEEAAIAPQPLHHPSHHKPWHVPTCP